jgi:pyruvate formate lyase activating enzyme
MDIKNSKAKYKETAGINNLDLSKIEESVDFLINGNMDFEFRTTIVNEFHTVEDIQDIVVWIKGAHKYFLQNFVDSGDLIGQDLNPVTLDTLRVMREKATEIVPNVELRGIS